MNTTTRLSLFLLFLTLVFSKTSHAQDSLKYITDSFPRAVLVELRAERNRINALKKAHRYKDVMEVEKDALGERVAMIKDFSENLTFCPVYYFIDTNADLIKEKKFDGILMNADGSPVEKHVVDSQYVIAMYGYLSTKYKPGRNKVDSVRQVVDAEVPFGRGLIITNERFQELTYFYKLGYHEFVFRHSLKKRYKGLAYVSKHFDIEYFPFVKLFNIKLTNPAGIFQFKANYLLYMTDSTKVPDVR